MPAKRAASGLAYESDEAIDDDKAVGDPHHPPRGLEAGKPEVRSPRAVELRMHIAGSPGEPEEATGAPHGVGVADGDEIMETRTGEPIPAARCVIRIGAGIFGDPLTVPTE